MTGGAVREKLGDKGQQMTPKTDVHEAVVDHAELGEGPTWDPATGRLLWVDILGCRIHRFDPLSGADQHFATDQHIGAAKPCLSGGTLSRIMPDGTAMLVLDDVTISNGVGWSPDGHQMYFVDTPTRRIDVFDYTDDGASARRPWVESNRERDFRTDSL